MFGYSGDLKGSFSFLVLTLCVLNSCSPSDEDNLQEEFSEEEIQALSETMGHIIFENIQSQQLKIDIPSLIQGITEAEAGSPPPLTKQKFFKKMTKYKNNVIKVKSSENLKLSEDFLEENKQKEDVVSLAKGKVQYTILEKGYGPIIDEEATPLVNYEGKLINGYVFDSTQMRGNPQKVTIKSTIPGFKMGIVGMKEGETRRLYIHPDLGYGLKGRLPPNSLLIFDVEVIQTHGEGSLTLSAQEHEETEETTEEKPGWLKKIKETVF